MRSAEAAKTTAALIEEAVANANGGVQLNAETLKTLQEINSQVEKVSGIVAELSATNEQQAKGVEQINTAVMQMNGVTQQVASSAEESASAAEELSSQSNVLSDMVGRFQLSTSHQPSRGAGSARRDGASSRPVARAPQRQAASSGGGYGKVAGTVRAAGNGHAASGNGASRLSAEELFPFGDDSHLDAF